MVNLDPLQDAYIATDDVGEENLILSLILSIKTGSQFPRQFYESGEAGPYCSSTTYKALGKVLESCEEEERLKKGEGQGESRGKKSLDFTFEPVDSVCDSGEGSSVATKNARSKKARPHTKIRARRKATLVARRRMRGLPDVEYVVLSSDDDNEEEEASSPPPKKACPPLEVDEAQGPPVQHCERRMNPRVDQPSN